MEKYREHTLSEIMSTLTFAGYLRGYRLIPFIRKFILNCGRYKARLSVPCIW